MVSLPAALEVTSQMSGHFPPSLTHAERQHAQQKHDQQLQALRSVKAEDTIQDRSVNMGGAVGGGLVGGRSWVDAGAV